MKKGFFDSGYLMVVAGLTATVIAILADAIGIGDSGFGLDQLAGVILGLFALSAGLLELYVAIEAPRLQGGASKRNFALMCGNSSPTPPDNKPFIPVHSTGYSG